MSSTRRLAHLFSSFSHMGSHMICACSPRLSRGSCDAFDGSLACRAPSPRSLAHVLRVARVVSASPVTRLTWRFRWLARVPSPLSSEPGSRATRGSRGLRLNAVFTRDPKSGPKVFYSNAVSRPPGSPRSPGFSRPPSQVRYRQVGHVSQ